MGGGGRWGWGCNGGLRNPADTATPPESGWQYHMEGGEWQSDDRSLGLQWGGLEPCARVEVGGRALPAGDTDIGSYTPTGNWRSGRPIYRQTAGGTRYLKLILGAWGVYPKQLGVGPTLRSGRGTLSPGDPAAGPSVKEGLEGWKFWDGSTHKDSRGMITVICHTQ